MSESVLPTWADIVAIGSALVSGAYSFGVIGQKVKSLELALTERSKQSDELERDFRDVSSRLSGLEANMTSVLAMLSEVRSAVLYKGSGGH
jgi:hypothetical protein